jgi:hypothetical protein
MWTNLSSSSLLLTQEENTSGRTLFSDSRGEIDTKVSVGVQSTRHHGQGVTEVMSRIESVQVSVSQCESRVEHRRTLEIIMEHSSYIGQLVYK